MGSGDYFYTQLNFKGATQTGANIAAGYIQPGGRGAGSLDGWHTFTTTGTVPSTVNGEATVSVQPFIVFYNYNNDPAGTAMYIDKVLLQISP